MVKKSNTNQTNKRQHPKPKGIAVINFLSIYIFKSLSLATQVDTFDNKIDDVFIFLWI